MARSDKLSRRLGVESLEGRQLMAVLVSVAADGDLVVTGDGQADQVSIVQAVQNNVPTPGRYYVSGLNGTTINGQTGLYFENVTDDIRVNLGGNNDRLTVGDGINGHFIAPDDLEIQMGGGADVVNINSVTIRDDAAIVTGDGNDSVRFRGTVGALGGVDNGENDLLIDTGARADNVRVQNTFVRRDLTIATGLDAYTDAVDLLVGNIGDDTLISTGGGNDIVRIADVGFNDDVTINTGAGNDVVTLNRSEVDEIFASLGSGTDRLELRDSSGRRATLNGGIDRDTLVRVNSPFKEFFQATSF